MTAHRKTTLMAGAIMTVLACGVAACSESTSYSDLLRDETKAVNWFLAGQLVENDIPSDSVFVTGNDAPYYRMDEEGYIYMQVINPGNPESRAAQNDKVYFLFDRRNILQMYETGTTDVPVYGNSTDLNTSSSWFMYKNTLLESTTKYGTGIQTPLDYLGYDCEVNLVLKSYYGFVTEQSTCTPYLLNVRYFKAQY